jgi:hypothetical protein
LNGTFVADSPARRRSANGTFVASPSAPRTRDAASASPVRAQSHLNGTFCLDDEPAYELEEPGPGPVVDSNQTFAVPPQANFNGDGNFGGNKAFDSPVDSNFDSQGSQSQESLCSGASGVSADSDSLHVKQRELNYHRLQVYKYKKKSSN